MKNKQKEWHPATKPLKNCKHFGQSSLDCSKLNKTSNDIRKNTFNHNFHEFHSKLKFSSTLCFGGVGRGGSVEWLYCKRPILRLSSSKILTPNLPHRPASVYPPPHPSSGAGEDTLAGWKGGGGSIFSIFWKTPDTALYSTYVSTL